MANDPLDGPGPAVDALGRAVVDPTANVLQLVEAAIKRQDDLRESEARHVREILTVRKECDEEMRSREGERIRLVAEHDKELREAETKRIDAIRQVDVAAVQQAAQVAADAASALAATLATTAEAARNQVAAAAQAGVVSLAAALEPIQKDVAELRKVQYEQAGQKAGGGEAKDSAAELAAALKPLFDQIGLLAADRNRGEGRKAAFDQGQLLLIAVLGLGAGFIGHFIH